MVKKIIYRLWLIVIMSAVNTFVFAQEKNSGLDEVMRSNNKIYVVMAVCVTILVGLILYLVSIDRKVSKKEESSSPL